MSDVLTWNPCAHPFHQLLQVGDVLAAASARFFATTYAISLDAHNGGSYKDLGIYKSTLRRARKEFCKIRDSILSHMPEGMRQPTSFAQDLYRKCMQYVASRSKTEPKDLKQCISSVSLMLGLNLHECPLGNDCFGWDQEFSMPKVYRDSEERIQHSYSHDERVKILLMLAELGEPELPFPIRTRQLRFWKWPFENEKLPIETELHEWVMQVAVVSESQGSCTQAHKAAETPTPHWDEETRTLFAHTYTKTVRGNGVTIAAVFQIFEQAGWPTKPLPIPSGNEIKNVVQCLKQALSKAPFEIVPKGSSALIWRWKGNS